MTHDREVDVGQALLGREHGVAVGREHATAAAEERHRQVARVVVAAEAGSGSSSIRYKKLGDVSSALRLARSPRSNRAELARVLREFDETLELLGAEWPPPCAAT